MWTSFLPFDETKTNKMLANFLKYMGGRQGRRLRAQALGVGPLPA